MERDPWYFSRREFANQLLASYGAIQTHTLYSPRRTGKTYFIHGDLVPAALAANLVPIYIDLWIHKRDVGVAIVNALRRAHTDITRPATRIGRSLAQPVTRVEAFGFGITLADTPDPAEPADKLSRIGYWFNRVVDATDKRVLLIVDEAQQIALDSDGDAVGAALRSLLQMYAGRVWAFFTGSSQHNLALMFDDAKAPFYEFGQRMGMPKLGPEFVEHLADRFEETARHLSLDRVRLIEIYESLDRRPGPIRDLLTVMLRAGSHDIEPYAETMRADEQARAELLLAQRELTPIELHVLARLACGRPYTSMAARRYYATITGAANPVNAGTVARVVSRMSEAGLIDRVGGRGKPRIALASVREYLTSHYPQDADE